jgi:hypothetical protein
MRSSRRKRFGPELSYVNEMKVAVVIRILYPRAIQRAVFER